MDFWKAFFESILPCTQTHKDTEFLPSDAMFGTFYSPKWLLAWGDLAHHMIPEGVTWCDSFKDITFLQFRQVDATIIIFLNRKYS